ncbi:MAG: hypothetical protein IJX57_00745, partial [Clostridia bacterium]|nr:hypothetical protein [Clostridia bacterium]
MKLKKAAALICTVAMAVSAMSIPAWANTVSSDVVQTMSDTMQITKAQGHLESAYVEWTNTSEADSYNVFVKGGKFTDYTKIDDELVRYYGDYYRADVLGLPAGQYTIKVEAVKGDTVDAVETQALTVTAHTREGFAFSENSPNKTASGGYNDDGSISDDANIIYITADNVKTVQATVYEGTKAHECTGLEEILQYLSKGKDSRQTIIRVIGTVMAPVTDRYTGEIINSRDDIGSGTYAINDSGYLVLKGSKNLTLEGVGNDATLKGIGILIREANNVEVRNLGVMLFADDGISIDTNNNNIWVHNNDVFYGMPGKDSDQKKGDGSIDCKKSQYVTISSNHIWDGGKANLLDAGATTDTSAQSNYITYHHNWFDHSDSRHPRIRHASVHIYNNYFDGNSKYGTGVTSGASAFVEANVYRNCKNPFFSSEQGSEGGNTLSNEAGGIIKAYNNAITGSEEIIYASADNKNDFDAYLAKSRDEQISSDYTTLLNTYDGATYPNTYNNFDTDTSIMYDYTAEGTETVVATVEKYAGRGENADFTYDFDDEEADTSHDIDETLKAQLSAYDTTLVYAYCTEGATYPATGIGATPMPKPTAEPTSTPDPNATPTPVPTARPTQAPATPLPDGTVMWYAGETVEAGASLTIPGLISVENMSGGDADIELNGIAFTGTARGKNNASDDGKSGASIKFIPESDGAFTVYFKSDKCATFYIKDADG